MFRSIKGAVTLVALALVGIVPPALPACAAGGVKAGYLKCDVAGNLSFVIGSSRDVTCLYHPNGSADNYTIRGLSGNLVSTSGMKPRAL
jgi:hypothetical protein